MANHLPNQVWKLLFSSYRFKKCGPTQSGQLNVFSPLTHVPREPHPGLFPPFAISVLEYLWWVKTGYEVGPDVLQLHLILPVRLGQCAFIMTFWKLPWPFLLILLGVFLIILHSRLKKSCGAMTFYFSVSFFVFSNFSTMTMYYFYN